MTLQPSVVPAGFQDIRYAVSGRVARITIARAEVHNALRPRTLLELSRALADAAADPAVGVVVLTGEGGYAFCSGADPRMRDSASESAVHELQRQIRTLPKPVIAMVAGYAIGGGHELHVVCDLTIAADNAIFGQTSPRTAAGDLAARQLPRMVGPKKAREIVFLCRQYTAAEALEMGLVNAVVPVADLEAETLRWCREILCHSSTALGSLKAAMNAGAGG